MNAIFAQPVTDADRALQTYLRIIRDGAAGLARSQQTAIGPSEVGEPCARRLAYKMCGTPAANPSINPMPSIIGTGAHEQFAAFFRQENERLGRRRFLIEERVTCGIISGSCDLYDSDTCSVVDWKFPGPRRYTQYRDHGPSDLYRIQVHTYGYGHALAGRSVKDVSIVFINRGGQAATIWTAPYDEAVATRAQARLEGIAAATDAWAAALGGDLAQVIAKIPPTPSELCPWCPHHRPGGPPNLAAACPGAATQ